MPTIKLSRVTFSPPRPKPGSPDAGAGKQQPDTVTVGIPAELVDKLWNAIDVVPGLTLETALTMALQQFLRTLPADFEREDD